MSKSRRKRHRWGLVLLLGLAALLIYATGRGCTPESAIAAHLGQLTDRMKTNLETPAQGVTAYFDYLQQALPELLEQTGELVVTLDRIEDETERNARADEMVAVLREPVQRYAGVAEEFWQRVADDERAREVLGQRLQRLERLGEIFQRIGAALGGGLFRQR